MSEKQQLTLEAAKAFLLELAKSRTTQLEVFAERGSSTSISAYNGEVDAFNVSRRVGIGLRVLHNGAWGYAHTENLSQAALELAFAMALEHADLVAPEQFAVLGAWPEAPHIGDLFGEGLSGVTVDGPFEQTEFRGAIHVPGRGRGRSEQIEIRLGFFSGVRDA
jgi:PmbA protein